MSNFTPISQLPVAAGLTGSEVVPIVQNGVTSQTTVSQITVAFASGGSSYQNPSTGFNIVTTGGVGQLILDPAGTLASGTITFPPNPTNNQRFGFSSTQQINALTCVSAGGGSVNGAPTAIGAGGFANFIYISARAVWFRVG